MANLTLKKNPAKGELTNSGTRELAKMRLIDQIQTGHPFVGLFPINPVTLQSIENSMTSNGYDTSQPIHIWKEESILLDGHTRLTAARNCGLKQIPVFEHSFPSQEEALEYAISLQKNRRNLTDAEMMACLDQLDQLKSSGRKSASDEANSSMGKSAASTAEILGTSRSKVEKMRTVKNHGTQEMLEEVASGRKSINKAYGETVRARKNNLEEVSSLSSRPSQQSQTDERIENGTMVERDTLTINENTICLVGDDSDDDLSILVTIHPEKMPILEKIKTELLQNFRDDLDRQLKVYRHTTTSA